MTTNDERLFKNAIAERIPAVASLQPWCSCCGYDIHEFQALFWVEPDMSYGSGAGSDAYSLVTTSQIEEKRRRQKFTTRYQAENDYIEYVDYDTYRRLKLGL